MEKRYGYRDHVSFYPHQRPTRVSKQNIAWHTKVGINYKLYVIDASKRPNEELGEEWQKHYLYSHAEANTQEGQERWRLSFVQIILVPS